ncbi:MAG: primosomal protein N', partial [Luminiphilus sp.]
AVLDNDWSTLSEQLLTARRQQGLPPHGALAALRCDSPDANAGLLFLQQLAEQPGAARGGARIVGPLAAPMARRAGLYRSHLIVAGGSRGAVQAAMKDLVAAAGEQRAPTGLRWFVDIDPSEPL